MQAAVSTTINNACFIMPFDSRTCQPRTAGVEWGIVLCNTGSASGILPGMKRILRTLLTLLWGLWFGGLVMLFLAVQSLFKTFEARRDVAGWAASDIFKAFNHLHSRSRAFHWYSALLFGRKRVKSEPSGVSPFLRWQQWPSPAPRPSFAPGRAMRLAGQTDTPEFKRMHGLSMVTYLVETVMVLVAGVLIAAE